MPKKKEKAPPKPGLKPQAGLAALLNKAEKESKEVFRGSEIADGWRYIDFYDVTNNRPLLPMEYLHGTRGLLTGRVLKYEADEAAGKSSLIYLSYGMGQKTGGIYATQFESEDAPPPPDFMWHLGCDPSELLFQFPHSVTECLEAAEQFVMDVRDDAVDPNNTYPIMVGIDSVSGLGAKELKDKKQTKLEKDKEKKAAIAHHARAFSTWFREKLKLFERKDAVILASAQLKRNISTTHLPGGGGEPEVTTIAAKAFAFHASWIVLMGHKAWYDKETRKHLGEVIEMKITKNKLAPKNRKMSLYLVKPDRFHEASKPGWLTDEANIELFFGPNSPFDLAAGEANSASGWYRHVDINGDKNLRKEDFINEFYANEALVMQARERLRIRGFGFKFETDYRNPYNDEGEVPQEADDAQGAGTDPAEDPGAD